MSTRVVRYGVAFSVWTTAGANSTAAVQVNPTCIHSTDRVLWCKNRSEATVMAIVIARIPEVHRAKAVAELSSGMMVLTSQLGALRKQGAVAPTRVRGQYTAM